MSAFTDASHGDGDLTCTLQLSTLTVSNFSAFLAQSSREDIHGRNIVCFGTHLGYQRMMEPVFPQRAEFGLPRDDASQARLNLPRAGNGTKQLDGEHLAGAAWA